MKTIVTDDGREYTDIELGDIVPARGHVPGECVEGCWVCQWLGIRVERREVA